MFVVLRIACRDFETLLGKKSLNRISTATSPLAKSAVAIDHIVGFCGDAIPNPTTETFTFLHLRYLIQEISGYSANELCEYTPGVVWHLANDSSWPGLADCIETTDAKTKTLCRNELAWNPR